MYYHIFLLVLSSTISGGNVPCSSEFGCLIEEDNLIEATEDVTKEEDCQALCATNTECNYYTWYDDTTTTSFSCNSFTSCNTKDTSCSGCFTGPPHCQPENYTSGVIISGGAGVSRFVELYVPSTGFSCRLPSLPEWGPRKAHTMNEKYICGGSNFYSRDNCIEFASGEWSKIATTAEYRDDSTSWLTPQGLVLIGGSYNSWSTEIVNLKGGQGGPGFTLKFQARGSCTIPDDPTNTMILTGYGNVTRYSLAGFVEDLPPTIMRRNYHGCGSYNLGDGSQVLLVAGGWTFTDMIVHSSTEILTVGSTAWRMVGELPRAMSFLRGISIDNTIIMTGGWESNNNYPDILEWDKEATAWRKVGEMLVARDDHAMATAKVDADLINLCQ